MFSPSRIAFDDGRIGFSHLLTLLGLFLPLHSESRDLCTIATSLRVQDNDSRFLELKKTHFFHYDVYNTIFVICGQSYMVLANLSRMSEGIIQKIAEQSAP